MKSKLLSFSGVIICVIIASCTATKKGSSMSRDGSSYENAIKVNSIGEEYEYARKACADCRFVEQSLSFHKDKPYDVLTYEKSNGEKVTYYFDISSFYGKGF